MGEELHEIMEDFDVDNMARRKIEEIRNTKLDISILTDYKKLFEEMQCEKETDGRRHNIWITK